MPSRRPPWPHRVVVVAYDRLALFELAIAVERDLTRTFKAHSADKKVAAPTTGPRK